MNERTGNTSKFLLRTLSVISLIVILIFLVPLVLFMKDFSRNKAWMQGVKSVQQGSYFNLTIGMDAHDVPAILTEIEFEDISYLFPREDRIHCSSDNVEDIDDTYIFSDQSFRSGTICVSVRNGKVKEIRTDYSASMI